MIKFAPFISIYGLKEEFEPLNEVIWTFSKHLKHIGTQGQRFNIHLVDYKEAERICLEGSIKSVWVFLDQSLLKENDVQKNKKVFLELITQSLIKVANPLNWDKDNIKIAYNKSIEDNLTFIFQSKRASYNLSKSHKTKIRITLNELKASVYILISDKNEKNVKEVLLIETFAHNVSFFRFFDKPLWLNDNQFGFIFYNGISLYYSKDNKEIGWNHTGSEEDLGFIRSCTFRTFSSKQERTEWTNGLAH